MWRRVRRYDEVDLHIYDIYTICLGPELTAAKNINHNLINISAAILLLDQSTLLIAY